MPPTCCKATGIFALGLFVSLLLGAGIFGLTFSNHRLPIFTVAILTTTSVIMGLMVTSAVTLIYCRPPTTNRKHIPMSQKMRRVREQRRSHRHRRQFNRY